MNLIAYPCCDKNKPMLVKGAPWIGNYRVSILQNSHNIPIIPYLWVYDSVKN